MSQYYLLQPDPAVMTGSDELAEVRAELVRRGYTPFDAGEALAPDMDAGKALVLIQAGAEYLAKLSGAKTGARLTADMVNRGLLALLKGRDRWGTGGR